jgi:predicted alpha-1,2-mannosidase
MKLNNITNTSLHLAILISFALFSCKNNQIVQPNTTTKQLDLIKYVDPNIGTAHSRWFFYTPASLPFGMAKPAPSTNGHYGNKNGWEAVGYDERHESIEGFANVHEFQLGGIVLMPTTGKLQTIPGKLENPDVGYRSRFDKKSEIAEPGYYKVGLKDYDVTAELTAGKRVGHHKYTFPANKKAHIIFDIGNRQGESGAILDAEVKKSDDYTIEGWVKTFPEYVKKYQSDAEMPIYFVARLNKKITNFGMFKQNSTFPNSEEIQGEGAGAYVSFDPTEELTVEIQVGISFTSVENAKLNLQSESSTFDEAKKNAKRIWQRELNKIQVTGGEEVDRVKFYTGLYHALLGRGIANDINGAYPKNDGSVGQLSLNSDGTPKYNFYNSDAIWGAFWNLTQLWALAWPEYYNDYVQTHLQVYKDAGWLGDGIANSKYVSGVGTNFVGLIIAAAYNCGIRNYDEDLALEAALKNELNWKNRPMGAGKFDTEPFVKLGYIPHGERFGEFDEGSMFSASHVLEYSFSAAAVAQFAKTLNRKEAYTKLNELSNGWQELYDDSTGFVRPKYRNGQFIEDFDPYQPWRGFQEGNAWQYTFYVPHQPEKLVDKMGQNQFNTRLDSLFIQSRQTGFGGGKEINAFAGVKTIYNHGNQPSLHIPWMFNFSGNPKKTQFWTRTICNEFYGTDGVHGYGYGQDEDQGQLGAWYVMASMGLFDVKGLTGENPTFQLGSPAFDHIRIELNKDYYSGDNITIDVKNNTPENYYVKSASMNGEKLKDVHLPFHELVQGAHIEIIKSAN